MSFPSLKDQQPPLVNMYLQEQFLLSKAENLGAHYTGTAL